MARPGLSHPGRAGYYTIYTYLVCARPTATTAHRISLRGQRGREWIIAPIAGQVDPVVTGVGPTRGPIMTTLRAASNAPTRNLPRPAGAAIPPAPTDLGGLADEAYIRLPAVRAIYGGVSGATIWRWVASRTIPTPIKLSPRVTVWRVGDIRADLAQRAAA